MKINETSVSRSLSGQEWLDDLSVQDPRRERFRKLVIAIYAKTKENETNTIEIQIQNGRNDGSEPKEDFTASVPWKILVMVKGSYKGCRVDFWRYTASRFDPYLFASPVNDRFGCGATALALLTGVSPGAIAVENGNPHFSDEFMVRFLRRHGYGVQQLTLCNVSASDSKVGPQHVVLLSQLFRRNEATWGVTFQGIYFHNFDIYQLENLSLLNKPVLSAYLVNHPRWRPPRPSGLKSRAPKPKLRKAKLSLAALGLARRTMRS